MKELAAEIKDIISNKYHEVKGTEHGNEQPMTGPVDRVSYRQTVKEHYTTARGHAHDFKERVVARAHVAEGTIGEEERPGVGVLLKEGIHEIKDMTGVHEFKERVVARAHVAEGTVGEEQRPGIGILFKEGVHEIKDMLAQRKQAQMELGYDNQKPSMIKRIKGEAIEFKERVVLRAHIAEGTSTESDQRPGIKTLIKEGVHEIQDIIAKKKTDGAVVDGVYVDSTTHLQPSEVIPGRVISVQPITRSNVVVDQMYPAPQIIHSQNYTTGLRDDIKDPVTIVYTLERYTNVPSTGITGLTPFEIVTHTERTSSANAALIMDKIHSGVPLEDVEKLGTPLENTIGDKIKNLIRRGVNKITSKNTDVAMIPVDRHQNIALESLSPVSKRELIKATMPVLLNQATDGKVPATHPTFKEVVKGIPTLLGRNDESNIKLAECSEVEPTLMEKIRSKVPFIGEGEHRSVVPDIHKEPVGFVAGGMDYLNYVEYNKPSLIQQVKAKVPFFNKAQSRDVVESTSIKTLHDTDNFSGRMVESHRDTLLHKDFEMITDNGRNMESHLVRPKGGETVNLDVQQSVVVQTTVSEIRPVNMVSIVPETTNVHVPDQSLARRSRVSDNTMANSEQNVYLEHYAA